MKQGQNYIDFYAEGNSNEIAFFTQTVYYKGDTFISNDKKNWKVNAWNDAIIYIKQKNDFFYRILFKLGFVFRLLGIIFLFISCFGLDFVKLILVKFKKEIFFSTIFAYIVYWLGFNVRNYWHYLSGIVARSVYFVLKLFFKGTSINISNTGLPFVGVNDFILGIAEPCSGIDSIAFFITVFFILTIVYWKDINFKKHILLFIPGLLGAYLVNIFRVFLIFLVGIFISDDFAVNTFHTNVSMIMFTLYFLLYWMIIIKIQKSSSKSKV